MKYAVVICGRIGSGKTTIVNFLASLNSYRVVSFGQYIGYLAKQAGVPTTREHLQSLGESLFREKGGSGLLVAILEHAEVKEKDSVLFDGVRHPEVLSAIRDMSEASFAIHLDASSGTRFQRHLDRLQSNMSFSEFHAIESHQVESGIGDLASKCDLEVEAGGPEFQVRRTILLQLPAIFMISRNS